MINEEVIRNTYMGPIAITTPNPITFSFDQKEDVRVFKVQADGTKTILAYGTGYTVDDTQNVFLISPILAGDSITVYRVSVYDQQRDFVEDGRYRVVEVEKALDKLTMQNQEQQDAINRSLALALNTPIGFSAELPPPTAGRAVCFNADATGFEVSEAPVNDVMAQAQVVLDTAEAASDLANAAIGNMPATPVALDYLRRNAANTAFEYVTPAQLKADLLIQSSDIDPIVNLPVIPLGDITGTNVTTNLVTRAGKVLTFPATSGQYADLDLPFNNVDSQTWEMIWCLTPAQIGALQCLESNSVNAWSPRIYITAANKIALYLSSNNSAWDIANATIGTYTVTNATQLYIKLERTATQYILSTSLNGVDYIPDQTITTTSTIANTILGGSVRLGADILANPFKGTIDLSKCSVKIAGGPNLISLTASPTFVKDRQYTANFKGSVLDTVLPTAAETVLRNIMLDFNIQPGRKFAAPPNAKWDYGAEPTFAAYPDLLMNLATINDMKLNFPATSGQYVDLLNVPLNNLGSQTWEQIWCITPTQVGVLQYFLSNNSGSYAPLLSINSANKIALHLSSNNSGWDIVNAGVGTYTVVNNTMLYIKLEFTGTQYKVSTSSTGLDGSWTVDQTITSSLSVNSSILGSIRLGIANSTPTVNTFKGIIDLAKSSVKIAGGRNLLIPEPDVFLNRIIYDTMDGGVHYKQHYSQVGV